MIYIDITNLLQTRLMTGIQRVVRELLWRMLNDSDFSGKISAVAFHVNDEVYQLLNTQSVQDLLVNPKSAEVYFDRSIKLKAIGKGDIFFDLDAVWNSPLKRMYLYKCLKEQEAQIFTYIYDLVPIKFPNYSHPNTFRNFATFITAVYSYCDLAFFSSRSSERDFLEIAEIISPRKQIPTVVTKLGSNFLQAEEEENSVLKTAELGRYINVLNKKYILFVGTLEPRKCQDLAIEAFTVLARSYPDLNLVFIGKQGWMVDKLADNLRAHPLLGKTFFWFESVGDQCLADFYKNAYIAIYCSEYEGFGLPIAESLTFGIPTVCSMNSSMKEVGKGFADYLRYNSRNELIETLAMYLDDPTLYEQKCNQIRKHYRPYKWEEVYKTVSEVILRYDRSIELQKIPTTKLQHVLISIRRENAERMIKAADIYVQHLKEYVIITCPALISEFEKVISKHNIRIVDENTLLREKISIFQNAGHQQKNWMLRAALLNLELIDDEFIMLDDDNIPIKPILLSHFKDEGGHYKAYFFHELPEWRSHRESYDRGQRTTCSVLDQRNLELLSYSSHCPQIINKEIFKEVIATFENDGNRCGIDEWSTYFNYAVTRYPALFRKSKHQTLNWPASPRHWRGLIDAEKYTYENYYPWTYELGEVFFGLGPDDYEQKITRKMEQLQPYIETESANLAFQPEIGKHNLVHGILKFEKKGVRVYIAGIPYIVLISQNSVYWHDINYKIVGQIYSSDEFSVVVRLGLHSYTEVSLPIVHLDSSSNLVEGCVAFPFRHGAAGKIQDVTLSVEHNGSSMEQSGQSFILKLVNIAPGETGYDRIDICS